jgi:hypothetical protein
MIPALQIVRLTEPRVSFWTRVLSVDSGLDAATVDCRSPRCEFRVTAHGDGTIAGMPGSFPK